MHFRDEDYRPRFNEAFDESLRSFTSDWVLSYLGIEICVKSNVFAFLQTS